MTTDVPMPQEIHAVLSQHRKDLSSQWALEVVRECPNITRILEAEESGHLLGEILDEVLKWIGPDQAADDLQERAYGILQTLTRIMTMNNIPPSETARAVFALRPILLDAIRDHVSKQHSAEAMPGINLLIDRLGLIALEAYQDNRETLITDQQRVMEQVSVPVVKIWDKILLIPLVGMLDSGRTQHMMETLLTAIENTQSKVAILDISGIPIVDSLVARHLIMTASSTQLMGAECIITGISAKIAKTIIEAGVDLTGILTRSSLADGLKLAFRLVETPNRPE